MIFKLNRRLAIGLAVALGVVAVIALPRWFRRVRTPTSPQSQAAVRYQCPMHPQIVQDHPGTCPICHMDLQPIAQPNQAASQQPKGTPRYYRHPMNPAITSPVPAKDDMGMDFIPVYEGAGASEVEGRAPVTVPLYKQQLIGVTIGSVGRRTLSRRIYTTGRIAYDPELYQAQAEYVAAVKAQGLAAQSPVPGAAARARSLREAARTRLRLLGLSEAQIETLASTGAPDATLLLTPPTGTVWMYADIFEQELPLIQVGEAVDASLPAEPGVRFTGRVAAIDPTLDMRTRSAKVRVELTSPEGRLRPGMYVNATLFADAGERLVVPRSAVLDTGTRQLVFVAQGQGRFEPREVRLGLRGADGIEVLEGLREGEQVATSGNFFIDAESQLYGAAGGTTFYGGREAAEGSPGRSGMGESTHD